MHQKESNKLGQDGQYSSGQKHMESCLALEVDIKMKLKP